MNSRYLTTLLAALVLTLGLAATAFAQSSTGRIDVTVEDPAGKRLPGVSVELIGPVTRKLASDGQGQAHFLSLPVGQYGVAAAMAGFSPYANTSVRVSAGTATSVLARLSAAGAADVVHAADAAPALDVRRETTTTNIALEELQNIPTSRDPWAILQSVPTVYADRVNVGGSMAGRASAYIGKGAVGTDNPVSLDGVPITDMDAAGTTSTFYDFDMFEELAVTTGGADVQNPTPGVQLNLVLKKGANSPHGSTRFYFANERLQGNNLPADVAQSTGSAAAACVDSGYVAHCGNRIDKYRDDGFEVGGPVLKDVVWGWGSGQPDETSLKNWALKGDWLVSPGVRANAAVFSGNAVRTGSEVGPTRPADTAWNQDGLTKYYKGEGYFVVGQNLFASARWAHVSSDAQFTPAGGVDRDFYQDDAGIWHNSYYVNTTTRPQQYAGGDASYFNGKHEVRAGFSSRPPRCPVARWSRSGTGIRTSSPRRSRTTT